MNIDLLYAPLAIPLWYCYINGFQRSTSVARPERGGEKRTAVWASRHEERCSAGGVSPHVCDPMVVPKRSVVHDWCNPVGSAVDPGRDAAAHAR